MWNDWERRVNVVAVCGGTFIEIFYRCSVRIREVDTVTPLEQCLEGSDVQ